MVANLVTGLISISIKEKYNNSITVEALVSRHHLDAKKVSVTEAARSHECKNNDGVCRGVRLREFPFGELPLYLGVRYIEVREKKLSILSY